MPISSDLTNPHFITKVSHYDKLVDIPNNMIVLDKLPPISVEITKRNCRGVWNFRNAGVLTYNETLEMYK